MLCADVNVLPQARVKIGYRSNGRRSPGVVCERDFYRIQYGKLPTSRLILACAGRRVHVSADGTAADYSELARNCEGRY